MSTPLADKTNNVAAFSPPQSPAKQLDVQQAAAPDLLSPVPPPPAEEVAASDPPRASTFETLLARVPAASDDALKRMAAGHVAFGLLFFTGVSPITVASWGVLAALIANGVATTVRTPATVTPPSVDALLQPIEFGLHAALALWARYKRGSPRLSFGTAVAAWSLAVSSAHISALALVWALYTSATSACAVKNERVSVYVDALAPHATAFCTRLAALSARIELPPAVAASAKAFVAYYPLIVGFVWAFLLDWTHKLLTAGVALLAYKAWASPEAVESLQEKMVSSMPKRETVGAVATHIQKGARRMTMSAGDLISSMRGEGAKAKTN